MWLPVLSDTSRTGTVLLVVCNNPDGFSLSRGSILCCADQEIMLYYKATVSQEQVVNETRTLRSSIPKITAWLMARSLKKNLGEPRSKVSDEMVGKAASLKFWTACLRYDSHSYRWGPAWATQIFFRITSNWQDRPPKAQLTLRVNLKEDSHDIRQSKYHNICI